ncbi:RnfABCDGE type electron transport complex subunit B [Pelistega ratti]|uniref:RnfABCDGE type electron transport complex subunit B n=1 Tax=Pelistega ratti TaxID=2652177 RepID=UPI00135976AA|nr:RnfABCDGE type electron transport complex subunit B [Pelistega ratti]
MSESTQILIQKIDTILPQTQCTKCGYEDCHAYATAIATKGESINRCPPGGEAGIAKLAALLNTPPLPLNTSCGETTPLHWAKIDENHCIGCTLCIKACPVDAIMGANKFMHTIISDLCSGCELCVPVCPVDCIQMIPAPKEWTQLDADDAKARHEHRTKRLADLAANEEERLNQHSSRPTDILSSADTVAEKLHKEDKQSGILQNNQEASHAKSAAIAMALARARARRQSAQ